MRYRREITASVTSRGRVTIPAEVRQLLGLREGGKVTFVIDGGTVRMRQPEWTLESAAGSLPPLPIDIEEAIRISKEDRAEEIVWKMREQ